MERKETINKIRISREQKELFIVFQGLSIGQEIKIEDTSFQSVAFRPGTIFVT